MLQRLLLAFLLPAALGSCGGGGGDGGGSPPPKLPVAAQAANLTTANAPNFANAVDVAARMAATMRLGPFLSGTLAPGTLLDGGCAAIGSSPATVVVTPFVPPTTASVTGTATFSNFDHCFGMRLSGAASLSGTMVGAQVISFNFTFTNLSFTAGAQVFQLAGSASLQFVTLPFGGAKYVMTLDGTVSGAGSFQLSGFRVESTLSAGLEDLLISGRLTMADGFVDIAPTASPVELFVTASGLQNGSVTMTGATTIATAFFHGATAPTITIAPR